MRKLIFVLFVSLYSSNNVKCAEVNLDSVRAKEIARITDYIIKFNQENEAFFRQTILSEFPDKITPAELDSLIIVGEPMYTIPLEFRMKPSSNKLKKMNYYASSMMLYYAKLSDSLASVYPLLQNYAFKKGEVWFALRLYTKSGKQVYHIEVDFKNSLTPPNKNLRAFITDFTNDSMLKKIDDPNLISDLDMSYKYLKCNIDRYYFILDNTYNWLRNIYHRMCIFNNKIYSVNCFLEKFAPLPIELILKDHLNEIDDCEIDKYLIDQR